MTRILMLVSALFLYACKTTHYYVVRHAEKQASTAADMPLSDAGKSRAEALRNMLKGKKIRAIYSTNYLRTRSTAQPLAAEKGLNIQNYDPRDTGFINNLRNERASVLIVGHSNTVDDIVNRLMGARTIAGDLPDTQYGDLFIVTKKGKRFSFSRRTFGAAVRNE